MRELLASLPGVRRVVAAVRSSYRRKLAAALLVVLLISAATAVGLYVQIAAVLSEDVEQSMTASTNREAEELTEWTGQSRLVARVMSEGPVYASDDEAAVRESLQSQRADRQETRIVNAYVIDRRNLTVETSARRELEGTAVSDLPWEERFSFRSFDDVRTTRPYDTGTGTTAIAFITPIRQTPGHLLVVTIDTDGVFERNDHPVDGAFTLVVDSNGTIVFADESAAIRRQYHEGNRRAPAVSKGLRGESGFREEPNYQQSAPDGDEYVAAYAPVNGTDWVVVEHAPADEAYTVIERTRTWIAVIGGIAVLGLLGVVLVFGADVTGSLSTLTARTERIENGEYDVTFDTDRPDEFGDLNRTLATTRDTLQRRIEEIRETRDALERSNVALEERSAMVSVLNRVLRHNVRNDVTIIAGHAETVAERVDDDVRPEIDRIQETACDLAAISEHTQRINELLAEGSAEHQRLQLRHCLEPALSEVDATYPDATVELRVSDGPVPAVEAPAALPAAVADVVDHLVSHNGGAVSIDVAIDRASGASETEPESTVVTIDDDGRGLPEFDVQAVGEGPETPLNHAEGLALWCLEWTVNKAGGTLTVASCDTPLEIRLPAVGSEAAPSRTPSRQTDGEED